MRELKYRVFDYQSKKMLQVQSMTLSPEPAIISYSTIEEPGVLFFPLIENGINTKHNFSKPLKFTGFKDYEAEKLYDGDIISFTAVRDGTQKKKFEIYFEDRCGAWWCKNGKELCNVLNEQNNDDWKRSQNWDIIDCQYVRIIGNIYQNPELLK